MNSGIKRNIHGRAFVSSHSSFSTDALVQPQEVDTRVIFKGGVLLSMTHKEHIVAIAWFEKDSDNQPRFVWAMSGIGESDPLLILGKDAFYR